MKNAAISRITAILILLNLGVAAFLVYWFFPGRRIPRHFNGNRAKVSSLGNTGAYTIHFSPNGESLLAAIRINRYMDMSPSAEESLMVVAGQKIELRTIDVESERTVKRFKIDTAKGEWIHMQISPDGKKLLSAAHFWPLVVADIRNQFPLHKISIATLDKRWAATVTSIQFSPDGKILALGTLLGVQFYDARNHRFLRGYEHSGGQGTRIKFGRISNIVRVEFWGSRRPHFVSVKTGKRIQPPRSTREFDVTFSQDGKYFAEIIGGNQVAVWQHDAKQSFKVGMLKSNLISIQTVRFSPDNKTLAVGGDSSTENPVRFYKLADISKKKTS